MVLTFFSTNGTDTTSSIWDTIIKKFLRLVAVYNQCKEAANGARPSLSNLTTALIQSKVQAEGVEGATNKLSLSMLLLRARAILLNAALSAGIGFALSWITKKFVEYSQRIDTAATKSKEAADAAQSTASSLKDLVSAYEELGDKSGWDTEDFDQAKDIQAEILDLAKEQGTLDENKLGKLDLQNGKYEEQLGILQDITAEQLEASRYELTQNKDAQGNKLVDTAKKNNRTHYLTVWSAPEMDMGDQIKNAGIDIFNKFGGYGPDDLKDADSIVDYYNEVGKALKYVIDNTTEAERAAGGTYHSLYQFLLDEQTALRDDVDSYNDSTDAINNNTNARRELQAVDFWQNDNNNSMDVSFTFDKVNSAVQTLEDTIDGFDASKLNDLLWGTNEGLSDEQAQALANLRKALTDMDFSADTNGVNAFIQALVQVGIVAQSSANGVDAVAQASQKMEDISSEIDEIQTAYKNATTAIDEYNKYGYLSADTLQTLLNEDFEYLSCLELVDGQLQVNTEKYQGMIAAQYQSAAMALVEKANAELAKIAQGEKKDAVEDATKATEDQATALTERVCPALGEFAKASMTAAAAQEFLANGDAAWSVDPERTKEVYAGLASGLNILDATVDQIMGNSDKFRQHMNGFDKETKNRNKNTAKSVTDVASAFDTLNKAMKEYNQYGYLCADTAKSLVGLDDKFTACLTKQGNKLQINVEQFRKFVKEQLKEANAAKDGGKSADEMNKILNYLDQNVDTTTISFEQLTDAIKGYGTAMDKAKEKTDAIKSAFSDLYDVGTQKKDNDFGFLDMDAIEKQYQAVRNLYENTDLFTNPKYASALNSETGEVDYNSDAFKQMFADHLKELTASARETGGAAGAYLAQGFEDAAAKIANNVMSIRECIDGIGSSLNYATDRIDHFQSGFSDISDIVTQYNTYGGLSIDNYQKLMSLDDDYIKCLSLEGNQLKFNTEAYKELFIAKLNAMIDEYDAADETKALAQRLRELRDAVIASGDGFTSAEDKAKNFETTLGNIKSLLSDLIGVFEKFNENKSNDLKIQGDAWIDVIDKRIDALNEENDAQERAIELAKLQDEYERAKANKTVHVYGGRGQGFVWKTDENAVREAGQNLSDKQREYKKKDEIDRLNKLKDKVQEANNLIGTSWDDYQKKLKYTAEFEAMTFEQMEGHYDGFKNSILDNMRDIQSVTNVSDAITNLEKLINTLKTLNDVITFFTSGGVSTDGGGIFGLFNQIKNMFTGESGDFDLGAGFKKMFDGAAKVVSDGWNLITGKNRKSFNDIISWNNAKLKIIGRDVSVGTRSIEGTSSNFFDRLLSATNGNLWDISGIFNSVSDAISGKTGNLFTDIIGFFTNGFSTANNVANGGLLNIVDTIGSMFGPIAAGAQSIGSAISSGVVSFFPSIFAGLGTLVTSVGSAMAGMMEAIATALSSIPIAG